MAPDSGFPHTSSDKIPDFFRTRLKNFDADIKATLSLKDSYQFALFGAFLEPGGTCPGHYRFTAH